jgi:hypothetical protein
LRAIESEEQSPTLDSANAEPKSSRMNGNPTNLGCRGEFIEENLPMVKYGKLRRTIAPQVNDTPILV